MEDEDRAETRGDRARHHLAIQILLADIRHHGLRSNHIYLAQLAVGQADAILRELDK